MADDDWQDWQPPQAAAASAQDDGWEDWQAPDSIPIKPPTDEWENVNPEQEPRGIVERTTAGFKEAYKPAMGDAVKQIAPNFAKEHPIISGVLQNVLNTSPVGMLERAVTGVMAAPSGLAGTAAGVAEKFGMRRQEADRLQRDLDVLGKALMTEGGMGPFSHARSLQKADVGGAAGLRDLKKQGQTPGSDAAAGVAQEPKPPAQQPVADAQNKTTLGTGEKEVGGENLNTRDYGKKTEPSAPGEASGVNVGEVDPTLRQVLKPETTLDAAQRQKFSGLSDETLQDFSTRTDNPQLQEQIRQELELRKQQPPPVEPPAVAEPPAAAPPPDVPPVRSNQVPTAEQAAARRPNVGEQLRAQQAARVEAQAAPAMPEGMGLSRLHEPIYRAAQRAAPELPPETLAQIARMASGPKQAAIMAERAVNRVAERQTAPEPVPAGTMELPPVEVRPGEAPQILPRPDIKGGFNKAARKARRAQREGKEPSGLTAEDYAAMDKELGVKPGEVPAETVGGTTGARLLQRGFSNEEISRMTPAKAREILAGDYTPQEARARGISKGETPTPKAAIEQRVPGETVGDALKQQKMTKAERQKFDYEVKTAETIRRTHGVQPKDPVIAAEIAKRDAAREAKAAARTEKIQAEVQKAKTADEIEIEAEHGRPATLAEMQAENARMSPKEIASEYYDNVGRDNHTEALKLFDAENSARDIAADPKLAAARELISEKVEGAAWKGMVKGLDKQRQARAGQPAKDVERFTKQLEWLRKADDKTLADRKIGDRDAAIARTQLALTKAETALKNAPAPEIIGRADLTSDRPGLRRLTAIERALERARSEEATPGAKEPVTPAAEKPPLYPHAALSKPKLEKAYEKARAESSKITDELIAAGRGRETGRDIAKQTDELSQRYKANSDLVMSLADEMNRRKTWGGTLKPIPEASRDSFYAANKGQQFAPQELPSGAAPPRITPEARPIEPTGRPVPEGARAEIGQRLDQATSAANPIEHLRETANRARELGLEGQARRIEQAVTELERQRDVQIAPGPGERFAGVQRQQAEGIVQRVRDFIKDEGGGGLMPDTTRIVEKARAAYNTLLTGGKNLINEIQMATSPMAARSASNRARAIAKDQANAIRAIDQQWQAADNHIMRAKDPVTKKLLFDETSRKEMWERADEENVMRQRGETSEHMGIAALKPHQRALVESFQPKARELWEQARDIGWVHGEGLPYYTPRLFEGIVKNVEGALALDAKGQNIQTTTSSMKHRKHLTAAESEAAAKEHFGDEAKIIRDIRTMPFTLAKMEKALVNRVMIKEIEAVGRRLGENTVLEGGKPNEPGWFTIPDNPAFYTMRPRYEKADTATYRGAVESHGVVKVPDDRIPLFDRNGLPVMDRVPIWIRGDFEGPLRAIMTRSPGLIEQGLMATKGKTMGLIMNSPAIHNMVEWGRAFPTMPGKLLTLQVYFEGNAAKRGVPYTGTTRYVRDWASGKLEAAPRNASPIVMEAINHGLVPIGKRFFNQDITAVMEHPDLTPGRSITAKALALVPDLFNSKAGSDAVKRSIDRAGDVWHNTLLWDRVGDLQMGLYTNAKRDLVEGKGVNEKTAMYVATHIANRYAGALPNEAMSAGARKIANFLMFSRTFTLGNLGVLKDMFTGLPRDVLAQIERDVGVLDPKAVSYAKSLARRKAIMAVGLDIGLMYIGNSVLQSAINVLKGDNTLGEEGQGYVRRAHEAMQRLGETNPLLLLNPITGPSMLLGTIESLSSTYENEPGKRERIMIGKTAEGRGVYMRNPVGKLGEEFVGYAADALDMAKRKMGTIARPLLQMLANDKGFGEKIYDPGAEKLDGNGIKTALAIAKQFFLAQTPEGQLSGLRDLATGQTGEKIGGVPTSALQAFGPVAGFSFSRGHPQGPAAGEYARMAAREKFEQQETKPEITKLIRNGKIDEAIERMNELNYPSGLRRALLSQQVPHMTPRKFRDMARQGTPEEIERFQRALERQ